MVSPTCQIARTSFFFNWQCNRVLSLPSQTASANRVILLAQLCFIDNTIDYCHYQPIVSTTSPTISARFTVSATVIIIPNCIVSTMFPTVSSNSHCKWRQPRVILLVHLFTVSVISHCHYHHKLSVSANGDTNVAPLMLVSTVNAVVPFHYHRKQYKLMLLTMYRTYSTTLTINVRVH